jgi:hypothetical protein
MAWFISNTVLPPLAVLLVIVASRAAMRRVGSVVRALFAWTAGSPFMHVDQAQRRKGDAPAA